MASIRTPTLDCTMLMYVSVLPDETSSKSILHQLLEIQTVCEEQMRKSRMLINFTLYINYYFFIPYIKITNISQLCETTFFFSNRDLFLLRISNTHKFFLRFQFFYLAI